MLSEVAKWLSIDLHIHTGASPCANLEMSPWNIVRMAQLENLDLIAITDHNTAANADAVMKIGRKLGLTVLAGMEVQTQEEVHLLAVFPELDAALAFEEFIWGHLPDVPNRPEFFGEQALYNMEDCIVGKIERLLLQSVALGVEDVGNSIIGFGGLVIAAHINRRAYSLISQLGFVPRGLLLHAVEVDRHYSYAKFNDEYRFLREYPVLQNSDAHELSHLVNGPKCRAYMGAPCFTDLKELLLAKDLKRIRIG